MKNKGIFAFVRRTLRAVKCAKTLNEKNKVDPVAPQPDTELHEPQADLSGPAAPQDPADPPGASKQTPGVNSAEPQAGPSEAAALDDPAEHQPCSPGESADLQNPGQSGSDQDPGSC
ncbi:hypothetical protein M9458_047037 [Cirrhinus mrigala]|uniref:Uncharacterized protein n=1 Tax=Cirrhinus mrigala TaxID=683832 RepID=A0ABD0NDH3_CIRMR